MSGELPLRPLPQFSRIKSLLLVFFYMDPYLLSLIVLALVCSSSKSVLGRPGDLLSPYYLNKRGDANTPVFEYGGSTPVRGVRVFRMVYFDASVFISIQVNLGGWLVLEEWMVPSLFQGVNGAIDEWTFCDILKGDAQSLLEKHWATWITESDFATIKSYGLNHVRIPIGYWAFENSADYGEPYLQGQENYLDSAIGWARENGLVVWIDLHGVPGSQNGYDNSGRQGPVQWPYSQDYITRAKSVLQTISSKYTTDEYSDVVGAIELVNEPAGYLGIVDVVRQFYYDGYGITRRPNDSTPDTQLAVACVTPHYHLLAHAFCLLIFWLTVSMTRMGYQYS
jgi:hypothetical protein